MRYREGMGVDGGECEVERGVRWRECEVEGSVRWRECEVITQKCTELTAKLRKGLI